MFETKYMVEIDGNVIAEGMTLETALVLVKATFGEYYNDHEMAISIKEMPWVAVENKEFVEELKNG